MSTCSRNGKLQLMLQCSMTRLTQATKSFYGEMQQKISSLTPTQLQELHHTLQSFSDVANLEGLLLQSITLKWVTQDRFTYRRIDCHTHIVKPYLLSSKIWNRQVLSSAHQVIGQHQSSLRMCVDYRRLNAISPSDAYPMPRVDDLIDRLGGYQEGTGKYL